MYWIAGATAVLFLATLWCARREQAPDDVSVFLKAFYKIALYLYKKLSLYFPRALSAHGVERDLLRLHPGESLPAVKTEFYVKKISMSLAVIVCGVFFGLMAVINAERSSVLGKDGVVERGEYFEEPREVSAIAQYDGEEMEFTFLIDPERLTEKEAEEVFACLFDTLPGKILGENTDLGNVTKDLVLETFDEEYAIALEWDSDTPEVLSNAGKVAPVKEKQEVVLTVQMSYLTYCCSEEIKIVVVPPVLTQAMQLHQEMEEMLNASEKEKPEEKSWKLPAEWRGKSILWSRVVESNGPLMCGMGLAAAAAVYLGADKDLHGRVEKRKRSLLKDYPRIVHKLMLFVGAGMTVRGAFSKVASEYERKLGKGERRSAYEEMLYTCRELQAGVSEGAAYEHFGKRTGMTEYIRLSALLMQNLKRGNNTLLERLREEADKAAEERLQQSKKLGEEAGTKLLVPMVLLLAVVMVMIMIPAFSTL